VSSQNAVKHGILSKEVLVQGRVHRESSHAFKALHQRFVKDLQPVGPTEEMLVDQIVTAHWRLRRALRAEAGEIALSVDEGEWERKRPTSVRLQFMLWRCSTDPIWEMESSTIGLRMLLQSLTRLRDAAANDGRLTAEAVEAFRQEFGAQPNSLVWQVEELVARLEANPDGLEPEALAEHHRTQTLKFLDQKIGWLRTQWMDSEEHDEQLEDVRQAASMLPPAAALDKIGRYEAMLRRQIERAPNQLDRLQRIRNGEVVPAPLAIC
jgi:hypothetical protein